MSINPLCESKLSYEAVLPSPIPCAPYLGLSFSGGQINGIEFLSDKGPAPNITRDNDIVTLLDDYFSGRKILAESSINAAGTAYQQRVWKKLLRIPAGKVATYGELARELASSPRAVAGACRANPIPILIPCHRVVSASGFGGYLGKTEGRAMAIKQWLLQHEGYV